MLSRLHIINFGIIGEMNLDFKEGFSVITGESGAGKSLLLQALELILGARMDSKLILDREKKSIIEGEFISNFTFMEDFFTIYEIENQKSLTLRREILPSGKSRSFINDSLVSLEVLAEFSAHLVDIHNQFDHRFIHLPSLQLEFLDQICNHKEDLKIYKKLFLEYKKSKENLALLQEKKVQLTQKNQQTYFLVKELNEIRVSENEFFELEKKNKQQTHFAKIKSYLQEANGFLSQNSFNLMDQLRGLHSSLEKSSQLAFDYEDLPKRIESLRIELLDIAQEVNTWNEVLYFDQKEAESTEQILTKIYHLQTKHGCSNFLELLKIREELNKESGELNELIDQIELLSKKLEILNKELSNKAILISAKRKSVAKTISSDIETILKHLDIPNAKVLFELIKLEEFNEKGINVLKIYFSANQGTPLREIQKSASGGELSRFMLAIKSISCSYENFVTLILDEIDVGISGKIANKMASMIEKIADSLQIITISHQPQLVAKASTHLKIYKKLVDEKTFSFFKELSYKERIEEIAQMISGPKITNAAKEQAIELLKR